MYVYMCAYVYIYIYILRARQYAAKTLIWFSSLESPLLNWSKLGQTLMCLSSITVIDKRHLAHAFSERASRQPPERHGERPSLQNQDGLIPLPRAPKPRDPAPVRQETRGNLGESRVGVVVAQGHRGLKTVEVVGRQLDVLGRRQPC